MNLIHIITQNFKNIYIQLSMEFKQYREISPHGGFDKKKTGPRYKNKLGYKMISPKKIDAEKKRPKQNGPKLYNPILTNERVTKGGDLRSFIHSPVLSSSLKP